MKLDLSCCELICELQSSVGSFMNHAASFLVKSTTLLEWKDDVGKVLLLYLLTNSKQEQKLEDVSL